MGDWKQKHLARHGNYFGACKREGKPGCDPRVWFIPVIFFPHSLTHTSPAAIRAHLLLPADARGRSPGRGSGFSDILTFFHFSGCRQQELKSLWRDLEGKAAGCRLVCELRMLEQSLPARAPSPPPSRCSGDTRSSPTFAQKGFLFLPLEKVCGHQFCSGFCLEGRAFCC